MKRITIAFILLLSFHGFSQVEVVENFDNQTLYVLPQGWTGDGAVDDLFACGDNGAHLAMGVNPGESKTVTTDNYPGISNGTELTVSFDYNIFEFQFGWPPSPDIALAPPADWGSLVFEYSTDAGANWTEAFSVDDDSFTFQGGGMCISSGDINLGVIADGSDLQFRFVASNTIDPISFIPLTYAVDNVSFLQQPSAAPLCNTDLIYPINTDVGVPIDAVMEWNRATGIAEGYTVSIGTSSGAVDVLDSADTTDPSYNLAGLIDYSTEYFVNIVAYNSFGNAADCVEQSFTTRDIPVEGASCETAFEVDSFPYLIQHNTADYENVANTTPCTDDYFVSGNDVFYKIEPIEDSSYNIELINIAGSGVSVHVTEGCIGQSMSCVAYANQNWDADFVTLEDVVLYAGNTYYVTISTDFFDSTAEYSMLITQNSCIKPAFTLSNVSDCDNDQFYIDVDVTSLGTSTTLELTDNLAVSNGTEVTATGVVNVGPYPSGTTVNVFLTSTEDDECFITNSTYFFCPPSNDDCVDSIPLTVNEDGTCTTTYAATNAGATESAVPFSCSFVNTNDVWFSFVATSENMVVEYLNIVAVIGDGGTNQSTELLEGDCGDLTNLGCYFGNYVTLNGLTIGSSYYIRNNTNLQGEYAQNYDICVRDFPDAPVNNDCGDATEIFVSTDEMCDNQESGSTVGATTSADNECVPFSGSYGDIWYVFNPENAGIYQFGFESDGFNSSYKVFEGSCGALTPMFDSCFQSTDKILTLDASVSYYIQVKTTQTVVGENIGLCVYQLPDAVENNDCSSASDLAASTDDAGDQAISSDFQNTYSSNEACDNFAKTKWYAFTPDVTGMHHFRFTKDNGNPHYAVYNTGDCSQTAFNNLPGTFCYSGNDIDQELTGGETYLISVTGNNADDAFSLFVYPDAALSVDTFEQGEFSVYPNPVNDELTIKAKVTVDQVTLYNMMGQQVMQQQPNGLNVNMNLAHLNKGIYFVEVKTGNHVKTVKVLKN